MKINYNLFTVQVLNVHNNVVDSVIIELNENDDILFVRPASWEEATTENRELFNILSVGREGKDGMS